MFPSPGPLTFAQAVTLHFGWTACVSIGGQAIGHLFGQIENECDLRAAPDGDLAIRVPAPCVGSLNR